MSLNSGDYIFPVQTFCMKNDANSPDAHQYTLSKLTGERAELIRQLNLVGLKYFSVEDVQITSWSLQSGLSYEEMTEQSKKVIDSVLSKHRDQISESTFRKLENKFKVISNFKQKLINEIPELQQMISFKNDLKEFGHSYQELSRNIKTINQNSKEVQSTPWSKITPRIYARFTTDGHFNQTGLIEVRVLRSESTSRNINSTDEDRVTFNIHSLIANPNDDKIQPLTFALILNTENIIGSTALLNIISKNPVVAALVLGTILRSEIPNWNDFSNIIDYIKDFSTPEIQNILSEAHDQLEKPLKDTGVISGKTKNTSNKKDGDVRQYDKEGGEEQLNKDFQKIPGDLIKLQDGIEYKTLPNGTKIIKRPPKTNKNKVSTLEVQPTEASSKTEARIRIKVRYK